MKRTAEQSNRKKQGIGKYIDGHMPLLMLLPASAAVIIVSIYPTLRTIGMSFFDKQLCICKNCRRSNSGHAVFIKCTVHHRKNVV